MSCRAATPPSACARAAPPRGPCADETTTREAARLPTFAPASSQAPHNQHYHRSLTNKPTTHARFIGEWYEPEPPHHAPTDEQIAEAARSCFIVGAIYLGWVALAVGCVCFHSARGKVR